LGGAGGDRPHDQGIMSSFAPFLYQELHERNFSDQDLYGQEATGRDTKGNQEWRKSGARPTPLALCGGWKPSPSPTDTTSQLQSLCPGTIDGAAHPNRGPQAGRGGSVVACPTSGVAPRYARGPERPWAGRSAGGRGIEGVDSCLPCAWWVKPALTGGA